MSSGPRDLILGMAAGYTARDLEPFVLSLRRTGFRGRCRLLVHASDAGAQRFLTAHGIEAAEFHSAYASFRHALEVLRVSHRLGRLAEFLSLRSLQPLVALSGPAAAGRRARRVYARLAPLHPTASRYLFYLDHLTGPAAADVDRVLLTDTRDVVFQRDPFDCEAASAPLVAFSEEPTVPIGHCIANADWMRFCYGEAALRELKDRPIFCSGTIMGSRDAMVVYLGALAREVARIGGRRFVPASGFDQACHNHLLYRSPPVPFTAFANGASPVMHLSYRPLDRIVFSPTGELLNDDGTAVNIVHQWDRHPALLRPLLDRLTA